jgi:hypothetical protein
VSKLFAAIAVAALLVPAAADAKKPRELTFDGSCDFSGAVTFSSPMTNTPQPLVQYAAAPGTCTGTLTDTRGRERQLDGGPVTYRAVSSGDSVSCGAGTATGAGWLAFAAGNLRFTMSETRVAAFPTLELTGARSGSAEALAHPSASQDPAAAVAACAGSGLEQFLFDAHMQTLEPLSG